MRCTLISYFFLSGLSGHTKHNLLRRADTNTNLILMISRQRAWRSTGGTEREGSGGRFWRGEAEAVCGKACRVPVGGRMIIRSVRGCLACLYVLPFRGFSDHGDLQVCNRLSVRSV